MAAYSLVLPFSIETFNWSMQLASCFHKFIKVSAHAIILVHVTAWVYAHPPAATSQISRTTHRPATAYSVAPRDYPVWMVVRDHVCKLSHPWLFIYANSPTNGIKYLLVVIRLSCFVSVYLLLLYTVTCYH